MKESLTDRSNCPVLAVHLVVGEERGHRTVGVHDPVESRHTRPTPDLTSHVHVLVAYRRMRSLTSDDGTIWRIKQKTQAEK